MILLGGLTGLAKNNVQFLGLLCRETQTFVSIHLFLTYVAFISFTLIVVDCGQPFSMEGIKKLLLLLLNRHLRFHFCNVNPGKVVRSS